MHVMVLQYLYIRGYINLHLRPSNLLLGVPAHLVLRGLRQRELRVWFAGLSRRGRRALARSGTARVDPWAAPGTLVLSELSVSC
jgi:hypothetical protein